MFQANVIRELINLHFSGKSVLKCCGIDMIVADVFFYFNIVCVVEFIEMWHLAWIGSRQTHIRIRSNWKRAKKPASKRMRRAHIH